MDLRPGTYVTPEVKLLRPLGEGGMGSVWLADHERLGVEVAVKLISQHLAEEDPAALARFRREAALSSQIDDPHAVQTFDHGVTTDGTPYLVMERLRGETLARLLLRRRRLLPDEVATVIRQVARALDAAHRLGVVHRDIKPDNVFVVEGELPAGLFVKVLDFGIAKEVSAPGVSPVTDIGAIVGTPEYMSPEQLLTTGAADERADRWALAVLAYQALTGEVPFTGETLPSLSLAICNSRFTAPSRLRPELTPEVDDWFARAFAAAPDDRFDAVLAMAEDLETALGRVDEAPPQSGRRPSASPSGDEPDDIGLDELSFDEASFDGLGGAPMNEHPADDGIVDEPSLEELIAAEAERPLPSLLDAPPDLDSGVRDFLPDADADQSGRRRALSEQLASQAVSPTFSGSAANLRPEIRTSRPWLTAIGVAAAAVVTIAVAGATLYHVTRPKDAPVNSPAAETAPHDGAGDEATAAADEPGAPSADPRAAPSASANAGDAGKRGDGGHGGRESTGEQTELEVP